jgi:hypothetical protein
MNTFLDRRSQRGSASSDKAGRIRLCRSGIVAAAGAEENQGGRG